MCDNSWRQDGAYGEVDATLSRVPASLAGHWTLLAGDSSMRMLYHLLLGLLQRRWTIWPDEVSYKGPREVHARQPCRLEVPRARKESGGHQCVEDAFLRGARLTFVWLDFAAASANDSHAVAQLAPLEELARRSIHGPDAIAVALGAWHKYSITAASRQKGRRQRRAEQQLEAALDRLLPALGSMFPPPAGRYKRPRMVALSLAHCQRHNLACIAPPQDPLDTKIIQATVRHGWQYFDRGKVTACPCNRTRVLAACGGCTPCSCQTASDCAHGEHHPVGATLNVVARLMLRRLGFVTA